MGIQVIHNQNKFWVMDNILLGDILFLLPNQAQSAFPGHGCNASRAMVL